MEYFIGQMVENMREHGKTENNMEMEFIHRLQVNKGKENGLKEKGYNGNNETRQKNDVIIKIVLKKCQIKISLYKT